MASAAIRCPAALVTTCSSSPRRNCSAEAAPTATISTAARASIRSCCCWPTRRHSPARLPPVHADVDAPFVSGHPFTFSGMDLMTTGIERIVLTTQFGFDDVPLPGGDLGARLHEADLVGLI